MTAKRLAFQALDVARRAISPDILARVAKFMHVKTLFDHYRIDLVFDVGANGGQFASTLRDYGFTGDILSFEPVAAEFDRLAAAAKADSRWSPFHCALGASEREQTINVMASSVFSSFNQPCQDATDSFAAENKVVATEVVRLRRLDAVIAEQGLGGRLKHALLKCDTQGFDLEVLQGAGPLIDEIKLVQIEMSVSKLYQNAPSMTEMMGFLDGHGFAPVGLFPVNRLADGSAVEFDYLGLNRRLL